MRYRIAILVMVPLILVAAIPALADDLGVTYLNGTMKSIAENASGTLDTASIAALQFKVGPAQISIPYSAMTSYSYQEEMRFRLGGLATFGVSRMLACALRHLICFGWK